LFFNRVAWQQLLTKKEEHFFFVIFMLVATENVNGYDKVFKRSKTLGK
jgi:hypothetical protein